MLRITKDNGITYTLDPREEKWTVAKDGFTSSSKSRHTLEDKMRARELKNEKSKAAEPKQTTSMVTEIALQSIDGLKTETVRLGLNNSKHGDGKVIVEAIKEASGWKRLSVSDSNHLQAMDINTFSDDQNQQLKTQALCNAIHKIHDTTEARLADLFEAQVEDVTSFVSIVNHDDRGRSFDTYISAPKARRAYDHMSGFQNSGSTLEGLAYFGAPTSNTLTEDELKGWTSLDDGSMSKKNVRVVMTSEFSYRVMDLNAEKNAKPMVETAHFTAAFRLANAALALQSQPAKEVWEHKSTWRETSHYRGGRHRTAGDHLVWPKLTRLVGIAGLYVPEAHRDGSARVAYLRQMDNRLIWTGLKDYQETKSENLAFSKDTPRTRMVLQSVEKFNTMHALLAEDLVFDAKNLAEGLHQAALNQAYQNALNTVDGEEPQMAPTAATRRALERIEAAALKNDTYLAFCEHAAKAIEQVEAELLSVNFDTNPDVKPTAPRSRNRP